MGSASFLCGGCILAQHQAHIPNPPKPIVRGCFQGWMGMKEGSCIPFSEPYPSAPSAGQKGLAHHLNL